ncbi:MAG TPA: GH116 family glycosyl hydrolase [Caulobacteraceae bacterium]|nr:GH116 family glycosyl hydrolase [Caulobacteraceae bacterium]
MAPRLQGELGDDHVLTLSVWGTGEVGRLRFAPAAGPYLIAPNRVTSPRGGLFVAQSAPVLVLRGVRPDDAWPSGAGGFIVEPRGDDFVVAMGDDELEAAAGLSLDVAAIVAEANAYVARCDLAPAADPLVRSLVMQGAHAAFSAARKDARGGFAGLAAGLIYSNPPRTYYRDGYWTLQFLMKRAPDIVAAQIELLARAVQDDGEAPSAVIVEGRSADDFERRRCEDAEMSAAHCRRGEFWSDHFDSPLMFVLAVAEHAAATSDDALAKQHWPQLVAVFDRYMALRGRAGLPVKPHNDRDWADNVYREGLVAYDIGLWIGALDALATLGARLDPPLGEAARAEAAAARIAADQALWRGDHYLDYLRPDGWAETHLALDALLLLRYDAVPEPRALAMLDEVRQRLESRRNGAQPYGDFGMLCCFPPFADRAALRAKSAFAYRYHNGGDWPWLDAVYAAERLRRGLPGWRYPLTRWWSYCLEQGWAGPVEHFSRPFGRGSLLQGWSSLPAAVALQYAERVAAGDPDDAG